MTKDVINRVQESPRKTIAFTQRGLSEHEVRVPQRVKGNSLKRESGYIALISVLLVGAIGLAIALSLLWLGVSNAKYAQANNYADQAKAMADYCVEMALLNVHTNLNYYGGDTITNLGDSCVIVTVSGKGNRGRTIQAIGTSGTVTRKVQVEIERVRPQIKLISWQEVADF